MSHPIESKVIVIRGSRVILDSDLAELYGVRTMRLNEQVTRNIDRFPDDFMFPLSFQEFTDLISQIAISKKGRGGRRKPPRVFTEHAQELQEVRFLMAQLEQPVESKKRRIGF